jgi:hypothetical protein
MLREKPVDEGAYFLETHQEAEQVGVKGTGE